jgi:hypothetical protein
MGSQRHDYKLAGKARLAREQCRGRKHPPVLVGKYRAAKVRMSQQVA